MAGTVNTYRRVIALTGPLLPLLSFLARLPVAMSQFGSVLLVAQTSGSLATAVSGRRPRGPSGPARGGPRPG
ncbi:MFS transporter, partial [Streptomyces sp. NPDC001193]